jgi:hypothetical protein
VRSGCLSSPNLPQCADAVSLFIISAQSASLRSKAKHLEYILAFTAVSLTREPGAVTAWGSGAGKYFGPGNQGWLSLVRMPEPEKLTSGRLMGSCLMGSWLTIKTERNDARPPLDCR